MRVLLVNQHPEDVLGGSEMQTDLIARGLHARGHDVVYGAVGGRGGYAAPYAVEPLPRPVRRPLSALLRRVRPDVVYWRYNKFHLLRAAFATRRAGARFVFALSHVSDTEPWIYAGTTLLPKNLDRSGVLGALRALYALRLVARARLDYAGFRFVDGVTSLNRDYVGRVPVERQVAIHNAVPEGVVPFSWPRPYILWVANIKSRKNPGRFVELAARCAGRGVDFLMVGKIQEPGYSYLEEGPARVPRHFHYLGAKAPEEVNGMLAGAMMLVNTCDPEGFGNNFIQAWRVGCPTVTLYFDPEGLIERERVGFASGTPEKLFDDVGRLIDDVELRSRMRERACALGERFSRERMVDDVERFLAEVVGARPAAG